MLSYALLARWKRVPNSAWKVGFAFALASHPVVLLASLQVWIPQLGDLVQSFQRDSLDLFLNGLAEGGVIGRVVQCGCIGAQGFFLTARTDLREFRAKEWRSSRSRRGRRLFIMRQAACLV